MQKLRTKKEIAEPESPSARGDNMKKSKIGSAIDFAKGKFPSKPMKGAGLPVEPPDTMAEAPGDVEPKAAPLKKKTISAGKK